VNTKIDDCKKYWGEFAEPDFADFHRDRGSVRKAFHCAISLFHMADWVYKEKGLPYWQSVGLQFNDRAGAKVNVYDDKSFANAIATINSDFELIRNIANSAKHFSLTRPGAHPFSPSHAANTYSRQAGFDSSVFDQTTFDSTDEVMLEGPGGNDILFLTLATSVRTTLETFCSTHGIALK
jgi:hypothetical protein